MLRIDDSDRILPAVAPGLNQFWTSISKEENFQTIEENCTSTNILHIFFTIQDQSSQESKQEFLKNLGSDRHS